MKLELEIIFFQTANKFFLLYRVSLWSSKNWSTPISFISMSSPDWKVKIFWGFLQGNIPAFRLFEVCSNYSLLTAYERAFPGSLLLLAFASAFFFSSASAWLNEKKQNKTKQKQDRSIGPNTVNGFSTFLHC